PDDDAAVRAALASLADRAQPLVVQLPRAAGQKEGRYGHTLSGAPVMPEREPEASAASSAKADALAALEERLRQLEERVANLEKLPSP
ncbi:MAG TPA: DUF480 domain-containing protein, partial [Verrucomicrobiae bacterium]|nr:DUF480 domain-containing protein [Verrucomicrobiae bacterium]